MRWITSPGWMNSSRARSEDALPSIFTRSPSTRIDRTVTRRDSSRPNSAFRTIGETKMRSASGAGTSRAGRAPEAAPGVSNGCGPATPISRTRNVQRDGRFVLPGTTSTITCVGLTSRCGSPQRAWYERSPWASCEKRFSLRCSTSSGKRPVVSCR